MMRGRRLHAFAVALVLVSAAGSLPVLTSSSFSDSTSNDSNLISAAPDWVAPTLHAAAIAKTAGGSPSFIKPNGTYYIYASATDSGGPASGIGSVKANVATVTTGQTAVPLVAGSYSVGGVSYQYRSAQLTAKSTLVAGAVAFSVTATDNVALSTTASFSVTGDNTVPSASDIQATNVAGGVLGKPELGDRLTLTYSEAMDWSTIVAGWDGSTTTNVGLVLINGGASSDYIQIHSLGQVQLPLGNVYLNRTDVAAGASGTSVTFGQSGTPTTMTASGGALTFVVGTASGTVGTAAGNAAMTWTPSAAATDRAGNASTVTTRTESGTADKDF